MEHLNHLEWLSYCLWFLWLLLLLFWDRVSSVNCIKKNLEKLYTLSFGMTIILRVGNIWHSDLCKLELFNYWFLGVLYSNASLLQYLLSNQEKMFSGVFAILNTLEHLHFSFKATLVYLNDFELKRVCHISAAMLST